VNTSTQTVNTASNLNSSKRLPTIGYGLIEKGFEHYTRCLVFNLAYSTVDISTLQPFNIFGCCIELVSSRWLIHVCILLVTTELCNERYLAPCKRFMVFSSQAFSLTHELYLSNECHMYEHRMLSALFINVPGYRVCNCAVYLASSVE